MSGGAKRENGTKYYDIVSTGQKGSVVDEKFSTVIGLILDALHTRLLQFFQTTPQQQRTLVTLAFDTADCSFNRQTNTMVCGCGDGRNSMYSDIIRLGVLMFYAALRTPHGRVDSWIFRGFTEYFAKHEWNEKTQTVTFGVVPLVSDVLAEDFVHGVRAALPVGSSFLFESNNWRTLEQATMYGQTAWITVRQLMLCSGKSGQDLLRSALMDTTTPIVPLPPSSWRAVHSPRFVPLRGIWHDGFEPNTVYGSTKWNMVGFCGMPDWIRSFDVTISDCTATEVGLMYGMNSLSSRLDEGELVIVKLNGTVWNSKMKPGFDKLFEYKAKGEIGKRAITTFRVKRCGANAEISVQGDTKTLKFEMKLREPYFGLTVQNGTAKFTIRSFVTEPFGPVNECATKGNLPFEVIKLIAEYAGFERASTVFSYPEKDRDLGCRISGTRTRFGACDIASDTGSLLRVNQFGDVLKWIRPNGKTEFGWHHVGNVPLGITLKVGSDAVKFHSGSDGMQFTDLRSVLTPTLSDQIDQYVRRFPTLVEWIDVAYSTTQGLHLVIASRRINQAMLPTSADLKSIADEPLSTAATSNTNIASKQLNYHVCSSTSTENDVKEELDLGAMDPSTMDVLASALTCVERRLLENRSNISLLVPGFAYERGLVTKEPAILVAVRHKSRIPIGEEPLPRSIQLPELPQLKHGVRIDVIEGRARLCRQCNDYSGSFSPGACLSSSDFAAEICGGTMGAILVKVGQSQSQTSADSKSAATPAAAASGGVTAGSAAKVVVKPFAPEFFMLTNAHVVANAPVEPARRPSLTVPPKSHLAESVAVGGVVEWAFQNVEILVDGKHYSVGVDMAIAKCSFQTAPTNLVSPDRASKCKFETNDGVKRAGAVINQSDPFRPRLLGETVYKMGATTRLTMGTIVTGIASLVYGKYEDTKCHIVYPKTTANWVPQGEPLLLRHQILIKPDPGNGLRFQMPGDSGSVLFRLVESGKDSKEKIIEASAIGLLHGNWVGNGVFGVASPIQAVFEAVGGGYRFYDSITDDRRSEAAEAAKMTDQKADAAAAGAAVAVLKPSTAAGGASGGGANSTMDSASKKRRLNDEDAFNWESAAAAAANSPSTAGGCGSTSSGSQMSDI